MAKRTYEEAFMMKVKPGKYCWLWKGAIMSRGYGCFRAGELAHRVSYRLFNGDIPAGMYVCHHCDNPRCVRPDHLFLGTSSDNMVDMVKKGRTRGHRRQEPLQQVLGAINESGYSIVSVL